MKAGRAIIFGAGSAAILGVGVIYAPMYAAPAPSPTATGTGEPGPTPTESDGTATETTAAGEQRFVGPAVTNIKGVYQLEIVVVDGEVVDVEFLQAGTAAPTSVNVNDMALPVLRERILAAQDWDVEYVSGASFTSPAMVESARGAFDEAGLG